jgi:hypothetical protein
MSIMIGIEILKKIQCASSKTNILMKNNITLLSTLITSDHPTVNRENTDPLYRILYVFDIHTLICDEAHDYLSNNKTHIYKAGHPVLKGTSLLESVEQSEKLLLVWRVIEQCKKSKRSS